MPNESRPRPGAGAAARPTGAFLGKQPRIVRSPALRTRDGFRRLPYRRAKRRSEIMEIHTIHHVSIPVSDLERSRAF